jgi:hypothetical protein
LPKKIDYKYLMGDFETTVYSGQTSTEVWASAVVELFTEDVYIFNSIESTWQYLLDLKCDIMIFYHNLKFDGEFWLYYFLNTLHLKQAVAEYDESNHIQAFCKQNEMPNGSFKYVISDLGQWYEMTVRINDHFIVFRDSLKLLPFSVRKLGEDFKTKHQKTSIEYKGERHAGGYISPTEKDYIANDVLVVKECLEIMFSEGHNKMTIGSCCMQEFKHQFEFGQLYDHMFPDLSKIELDADIYGAPNADAYIRKSYFGGWCYLVRGKENKVYYNGVTADVNSLYPSMMSKQSGSYYPVGIPSFWRGPIPYYKWQKWLSPVFFFVRFRCRFYLKQGKLPFIHIRRNPHYRATENLFTSDIYDKKTGKYKRYYYDTQGNVCDSVVEMTLTNIDFELFKEHYIIEDLEILDGCYFGTVTGMFDLYINHYKKQKMESTGAKRQIAKLFLNNLYGKFASSNVSNFRVAFNDADGQTKFYTVTAHDKKIGYIPIGSAITSYARNFTIRAAQANYYGPDKPGFIYADTDSIHCDLSYTDLKKIEVDDNDFCKWKLESLWDKAIFVRQKTYIEHVTHENLIPVEKLKKPKKPYYVVRCAGMPQRCKDLFVQSLLGTPKETDAFSKEEMEFLETKRTLEDFKQGLCVPSKLIPRHIPGGVVLMETTYELR